MAKTLPDDVTLARDLRAARKQLREAHAELKSLSNAVLAYIKRYDELLGGRMETREEVLARLKEAGKLTSALEFVNDHARYFGLGVDYRKDKKEPVKRCPIPSTSTH